MTERPAPTPEGALIGRAMIRKGLTARGVAPSAGISEGRWRQIMNGYMTTGAGRFVEVTAPAVTLARMARAVDVSPDELEDAGRKDAADILRDLLANPDEAEPRYTHPDDQAIWSLTGLDESVRRELIAYLQGRRQRDGLRAV